MQSVVDLNVHFTIRYRILFPCLLSLPNLRSDSVLDFCDLEILSCLHELFEVKFVSFGHLGRLFQITDIGGEVGILTDYAFVLAAFYVLVGALILQLLGLHLLPSFWLD